MESNTPKFVRYALRLHGVYFVVWGVFYEMMPVGVLRYFHILPMQRAISHITANIAGGSLFSIAILFLLASFEWQIPRFVYIVGLVQTTLNLYHDVRWIVLFNKNVPPRLTLLDAATIGILFVAYVIAMRMTSGQDEVTQLTHG